MFFYLYRKPSAPTDGRVSPKFVVTLDGVDPDLMLEEEEAEMEETVVETEEVEHVDESAAVPTNVVRVKPQRISQPNPDVSFEMEG